MPRKHHVHGHEAIDHLKRKIAALKERELEANSIDPNASTWDKLKQLESREARIAHNKLLHKPGTSTKGPDTARLLGLVSKDVPACGAETLEGGSCKQKAGAGTNHYGHGRCQYHHGNSHVLTHGRYSSLPTEFATSVERFTADSDPLNLEQDIALVRALVERWIVDYDQWYAAVKAWHESFLDGDVDGRPAKIADISEGHKLLDSLSRMVEKESRRRQNQAISYIHFFRVVNAIGTTIEKHVTDKKALQAIREEILTIRLPTVHADYT